LSWIKNYEGVQVGNSTVIQMLHERAASQHTLWQCRCNCGELVTKKSRAIHRALTCGTSLLCDACRRKQRSEVGRRWAPGRARMERQRRRLPVLPPDAGGRHAPSVRPRRLKVEKMSQEELAALRAENDKELAGVVRPKTRADCFQVRRPCPFVSCRHHLYLEVRSDGTIGMNFPSLEPGQLKETCALDVAEREKGVTHSIAGRYLNLTRARIGQIERAAVGKLMREGLE
jgi:hypothetical protein